MLRARVEAIRGLEVFEGLRAPLNCPKTLNSPKP